MSIVSLAPRCLLALLALGACKRESSPASQADPVDESEAPKVFAPWIVPKGIALSNPREVIAQAPPIAAPAALATLPGQYPDTWGILDGRLVVGYSQRDPSKDDVLVSVALSTGEIEALHERPERFRSDTSAETPSGHQIRIVTHEMNKGPTLQDLWHPQSIELVEEDKVVQAHEVMRPALLNHVVASSTHFYVLIETKDREDDGAVVLERKDVDLWDEVEPWHIVARDLEWARYLVLHEGAPCWSVRAKGVPQVQCAGATPRAWSFDAPVRGLASGEGSLVALTWADDAEEIGIHILASP